MIKYEHKKLFFICVLMILTVYVFGLTRAVKDTLVISALGVEVITTLKLYGTLPVTIIIILTYTNLLKKVKKATIYHSMNLFFSLFFLIYAFFIYPNAESLNIKLEPHFMREIRADWYFLRYLVIVGSNWTHSLFYIIAELWGSVMLMLLFWQIVNQTTDVKQAKKVYPVIMLVGQIGMVASGETIQYFANFDLYDAWNQTFHYLILTIVFLSLLISLTFLYLSRFIVGINNINQVQQAIYPSRDNLMSNLQLVFSSRYTILIMALIFCYAFTSILVESIWKSIVRSSYPDPIDYSNFMGHIQTYTAVTSMIFMLISAYLMRFITWKAASLITPIVIFITTAAFFSALIYCDYVSQDGTNVESIGMISIAIFFGAIQNIFSRSCHAFFDPTKEIAFIPLPEPLRSISKAFDILTLRLGKAGGAFIQWIMLSFIPGSSLLTLVPNVFLIMILIIAVWLLSVMALSYEFNNKIYQK
ncbi:MAG: NTP/NDP exchange transporter [Candidatus Midichloria sp.]|nr:NTP/NDP exchange transporter [Candidatus Midichloria sp.]